MESEQLKKFGATVKRIRLEKGIKQTELASMCDMERSNMNRLEAGGTNPTLTTILKIAEALGVSPVELMQGL